MYKKLTFNLGRDALREIIKIYKIKEMRIPYYLCDVVRHTLVEENCKPLFYHIDDNFYPETEFSKNDYILYPNYWGVNGNNVKKLINLYPKLIVDNAHSYFDEPNGFASFNAGHKFGFKNSYAFIKDEIGNITTEPENLKLIEIRKNEFKKLHNKYKNINLLKLESDCIPFCYPLLVDTEEHADKIVKELKAEGKIIYRYWNCLPKNFNEYKFYSRLIPIPLV